MNCGSLLILRITRYCPLHWSSSFPSAYGINPGNFKQSELAEVGTFHLFLVFLRMILCAVALLC